MGSAQAAGRLKYILYWTSSSALVGGEKWTSLKEEKANKPRENDKNLYKPFREHHGETTALNRHHHLPRLTDKPGSAKSPGWGTRKGKGQKQPMRVGLSGMLGELPSQLLQDLQAKFTWKFMPRWTQQLILYQMHRLKKYISTNQGTWVVLSADGTHLPHCDPLLNLFEMVFTKRKYQKSPF